MGGLVVLIILFLFGGGNNSVTHADQSSSVSGRDRELVDVVSVVLADTEGTWTKIFADNNRQYRGSQRLCCSPGQSSLRAGLRNLQWGRFTARQM